MSQIYAYITKNIKKHCISLVLLFAFLTGGNSEIWAQADFTINGSSTNTPISVCIGQSFQFAKTAPNGGSVSWDFGSGTPATSNSVSQAVIFNTRGSTNVTLTVDPNDGNPPVLKTVTINVFDVLNTPVVTNVTCNGGNNGSVTLDVTGSGNYSFSWSDVGLLPGTSRSNMRQGSYTITVTDLSSIGNCQEVVSVTVTEPTSINLGTFTQQDILCNGQATGSISVPNPFGGNGGITYAWTYLNDLNVVLPAQATQSNLRAGVYQLILTDAAGCTLTQFFTIVEPPLLRIFVLPQDIDSVRCRGGNTGQIIATAVGGTGNGSYTYELINGSNITTVNSPDSTFSNLSAGFYTVRVIDANNCTDQINVQIFEPNPLQINLRSIVNVTCNGNANGLINIDVLGGTNDYTYLWTTPNGSDITDRDTLEDLTSLAPGAYTITVIDQNNCPPVSATFNITEPAPLVITIIDTVGTSCANSQDGRINISVTGGTPDPDYIFNWTKDSDTNFATTEDLFNVTSGNYIVDVTDGNGCTSSLNIVLGRPNILRFNDIQVTNPTCPGANNGNIRVDVVGGVPNNGAYTYNWSPTPSAIEENRDLTADTYFVTVTDFRGCQIDTFIVLTQPEALVISLAGISPINCNGQNNGSIDINVTGGTPNYTYTWSGPTIVGNNQDVTNGLPGDYSVVVTDALLCTATANFSIPGPDAFTVSIVSNNVRCNGQNNGNIDLTVSGGTPFPSATPFYLYSWTRDGNFFGNSQDLTNLVAGRYCVRINDSRGCFIDTCITITEPTIISSRIRNFRNPSCFNVADGFAVVEASGGTPPYTYRWSNGAVTDSIFGLGQGVFSVTVRDANNCQVPIPVSASLTRPPQLVVSLLSRTNVSCLNGNDGAITVQVVGGTPIYRFVWGDAGSVNSASRTNLVAGTYSVTVSDTNSCTASLNITITAPSTGVVVSLRSKADNPCFGDAAGLININVSGGVSPYTFIWDSIPAITQNVNNLRAGQYCVTVTDSRGCRTSFCQVITQPQELIAVPALITDATCNNSANGIIRININGGTQPYRYLWSYQNRNTQDLVNVPSGAYSLTVTDARNCRTTLNAVINSPSAMVFTVDSAIAPRCSTNPDGRIFTSLTGGTPPYRFTWSNGETTPNLVDLTAGTYSVTYTDANGCFDTTSITLTAPDVLNLSTVFIRNVTCNGNSDGQISVILSGGALPINFSWSPDPDGTFAGNENIRGLSADCYTLLATDANGCNISQTYCITEPEVLSATITSNQTPSCNGDDDGQLTVTPTGGVAPYRYTWSNGATTQSITGIRGGTYSVEVRDTNNCLVTVSDIDFVEPDSLRLVLNFLDNVNCTAPNTGNVGFQVSGGTQPYTYLWSNGEIDEEINNLTPGTYCLTVTDANGCSIDTCVIVADFVPVTVQLESTIQPSCAGTDDGIINVTATGGNPPYTFLWSNAQAGESISNLAPGNYCVTVFDNLGCSYPEVCFTLEREPNPIPVFNPPTQPLCLNSESVVLTATPEGGVFTGPGIEDDGFTFNPSVAGAGLHSITYSGDVFGCLYTITKTIRVNALPDTVKILLAGSDTLSQFCGDVNSPYNILYTPVKQGIIANFSGNGVRQIGQNQYQFVPKIAGVGTHTIVGMFINTATQCTLTLNRVVNVDEPIFVDLVSDKLNVCKGESAILTATGGTTYTWLPKTGLNCGNCQNVGGTVIATPPQTTTYTVTGRTGGCASQRTVRIEVFQPKAITLTASAKTVCEGEQVVLRARSSDLDYIYTWSQKGTFPGAVGATIFVNPLQSDTFTVVGTLPNGCFRTAQIFITVRANRVLVEAESPFICKGQSTTLTATATEQGNFTYTWAPATGLNTTRGESVIAKPKVTTTYTVIRSGTGSCRSNTITITVLDGKAVFNPSTPQRACFTESPIILVADPPGGVFSAPLGVSGDTFDPATAGVGEHIITYTASLQGACVVTATHKITVSNPVAPQLLGLQNEYCRLQTPFQLISNTADVILNSADNDARPLDEKFLFGNLFDPLRAGIGSFTIDVIAPTSGFCLNDTTYTINVVEPTVDITGYDTAYCINSDPATLVGIPAGGKFSGRGIRNGNIFDPKKAGFGVTTIVYTGKSQKCNYSKTVAIKVFSNLVATATTKPNTAPLGFNGEINFNVTGGSGNYEMSLDGGLSFQPLANMSSVEPGIYNIIIRNVGGSCPQTIVVEVLNDVTICNPPTGGTVINITDSTATLNWGSSPEAISYEVDYKPVTSNTNITVPVNGLSLDISNLLCNTLYEFQVRSICGPDVISPNSSPITFQTTRDNCPNNCEAPADITAQNITTTSLDLVWIPVEGAVNYEVQYKLLGQDEFISQIVVTNSISLTNLTQNTKVVYFIKTICSGGMESEFIGDTTLTDAPCKAPTQIIVADITTTTAKITWKDAQSALSYIIEYRETGKPEFIILTSNTNSIDITDLTPGFEYEFKIRSSCGALGESSDSPLDTFTTNAITECKPPKDLRVATVTPISVILVWSPVDNRTAYEVYYREVGTLLWQLIRTTNSALVVTGLTENKNYEWTVRTECGTDNFSDETLGPRFVTTNGSNNCSAPVSLKVSNIEATKATLSWNPVANAIGYEIQYNIIGNNNKITVSSVTASVTISNLESGKEYEFVVRTKCSNNEISPNSTGPKFKTAGVDGCPAPKNLRVQNITNRSATLLWDAVAEANGYEVEFKAVGALSSEIFSVATNSLDLNNLQDNIEYEFIVRSLCANDKISADAKGPNFKTILDNNLCATPTGITATEATAQSIALTWDEVANAVSYEIDYRPVGELNIKTTTTNTNSIILGGLVPNTQYEIVIRAICSNNQRSSDAKVLVVKTSDGRSCTPPVNIEVINTTSASAEIIWQAVNGALRYEVEYKPVGANNSITVSTDDSRIVLANLLGNTEYEYVIRTVCSLTDISENSPSQRFITVVSGVCAAPKNVIIHNITDQSVFITWSIVPGATSYEVDYRIAGNLDWITMAAPTNAYILEGLADGTKYEIVVRSICPGNQTSTDNFINRFTTITVGGCAKPQNLKVVNLTANSVNLSWDNIQEAVSYEVEYREKGKASFTKLNINTSSIVIGNLAANKLYEVVVRSVCNNSRKSTEAGILEFRTLIGVDCGMTNFSKVTTTSSTISMNWNAIPNATGYEVMYRQDPNGNFQTRRLVANQLSLTLSNLPSNTQYTIKIRTLCASGSSDFSDNTVIVTNPIADPCQTPKIVSITTTRNSALIQWTPIQNAVGYTISYRKTNVNAPFITMAINSGIITNTSLTNLAENTEYEIRILARCGITNSQFSGFVNFKTLAGRLAKETNSISDINIYPNPTHGIVDCMFESSKQEDIQIKIIDLNGKILFAKKYFVTLGLNKLLLDFSDFSIGLYCIQIETSKGIQTFKVTKF